ncbi:Cof-type HAD-IIB family hydrolase [Shouchella shacheensis]|uniref:Cof-type HAD-IIB family hydrolase n=1 Tax=Shouchella shacheensis TaxID=1649580 RepID=UPI00073FE375|nr:Cof-type HAD-IIB family hydrolase [Shouchella shacheensis]
MLPRHLIALDLDGTLLPKNQEISLRTKKAIQKAKEQGHVVAIATGRPYRASKRYYQELHLTTPIINFNGAQVHHPLDPSYQATHESIDLKTARSLLTMCEEIDAWNVMVEVRDDFYLERQEGFFAEMLTSGYTPRGTGRLLDLIDAPPTAILVLPRKDGAERLKKALDLQNAETTLQRWWTGEFNIVEIAPRRVTKALGLQKLASEYGIAREHIIAFGDEDNDIEMITYAGQGVAMANAIDPVLQAAHSITASNEEDGIALYLEKALRL